MRSQECQETFFYTKKLHLFSFSQNSPIKYTSQHCFHRSSFFFHFLLVRFDLTKCVYVSERQSLIVLSFSNAADAMILSVGWQAVHSTTSGMKRKEK